jgi:ABC-type transport system substrate-binding protein/class 3 adenylate cyclase
VADGDGPQTRPALREERKVVTALFADLVGSTALGERLDPEDVKLVVGDAIARVVAEVERLGGHVKDLAGDGVLAFFGAPLASEDDPERAIRAGLRIAEEIRGYGEEVARGFGVEGFGVRVGIGTGPVVLGHVGGGSRVEYAAFGDTVNTAARIQGAARPGTVLVDEATRRHVEPLFEWSEPRALELKGKAAPVTVYEVAAARAAGPKPRGLEGAETALLGRAQELAAGEEALAAARSGNGGILFLTGEAGIGKSRLLRELRLRFDGTWLEGRCISYGESLPYWPFRDLLRVWLELGPDEPELRARIALRRRMETLFGEQAPELYPYLGALLGLTLEADAAATLSELSPEALQYRTFEVVATLLERLAADGPIVVAVEDLHWADTTSVQLLERILPLAETSAVLLALTQRDERDHLSWRLKEHAAREYPHLAQELALAPLSGDAERELLHGLVGEATLPEALERQLLDAAEGNPFFLEELVRSLADSGALAREEGRWRFDHDVSVEVPETVEKVVLARIDRLDPACRDILTAAAALGRHFGLPLLQGVLGDDAQLERPLHELQRLDLLRTARRWPEPEYRFKHVLIQEAAYRTLLGAQRRDLHRRAAEWLEARHAGNRDEVLGILAHHWLAAEDEDKAVESLARAGDAARNEWALDEAVAHYRTLLPLLERRGQRQETALVLFKLALALHTALRFREANEAYARAFELWDPPVNAHPAAGLRVGMSALPREPDPPRSYFLPDIQLQMALFDRLVERWPEATIVPSLAERWEVSENGLRYLFHLREGLTWSDGAPLTAADVEYGVKRSLAPERPGVSVAMFYVLENGQDYALGRSRDADAIGVRALDEKTVEFRLVAPAPYFLSIVNRADGGPQPRHAIEREGDAWTAPERLVVSGTFAQVERSEERLVLERRGRPCRGNVGRVELVRIRAGSEAAEAYARDELDLLWAAPEGLPEDERLAGAAAGTDFVVFDHRAPSPVRDAELRRALAYGLDRTLLADAMPSSWSAANGGIVPPALQGHTPEIAPRFDLERAREHLRRSGFDGELELAAPPAVAPVANALVEAWKATLGVRVSARVVPPGTEATGAAMLLAGWFPGYPDPEYFLRLLLQSEAKDNWGAWSHGPFDELIERARREPDGRRRLELFHAADRMAVAEEVAVLPLSYFRNVFAVKPWVRGWWEFGKSWSSFADLEVTPDSPRFDGAT